MGTEDFKRGVVSILLVLGLVFSMISVAPLASPGDWVNNPEPGGTTIDVDAGENFLIRHVLEWDEPEDGAYTITLGWYNYGNKPEENLTFVSAEAYFTTGANVGESIRADATLSSAPSGTDTKWALEVSCPAVDKDPRNGEFNVDIWMGAYGVGGVPHIPGDHVIPWMLGGVIVTEAYPQSWPRNPITIRVLGIPSRGVEVSISPSENSASPGQSATFTVTVWNTGGLDDNYDLDVSDNAIPSWGPTLSDYLLEVPAGENKQTTLGVIIPENAVPCTEDNITVTATSQENVEVYDSASCIAHAAQVGLIPRAPIYIDGNDDFIPANGVTSGSGTENDPYIIENWDIGAENGNGIEIGNTTAYFVIRNCYVHDGGEYGCGFNFGNVMNGKVDNNLVKNSRVGILLRVASNNNTVSNNIMENNGILGIEINSSSNNLIENCTLKNNNGHGILLYSSDNNIISNNIAENNIECGIILLNSDNNRISNNVAKNNSNEGITLDNSSNNNLISNNTCENNSEGIRLHSADNNLVDNNLVENNSNNGINLGENSDNNTISGNICSNNLYGGIVLYQSSNNLISNNIVENTRSECGIFIWDSDNNLIENNTTKNNNISGIYLNYSNNNLIKNNIGENNRLGIELYNYSDNNTISGNICSNNLHDGIILSYSNNNLISNNIVKNNGHDGIGLSNSDNNLVDNNLAGNNLQSGIHLYYSDNNIVSNNTAENNGYAGIQLNSSNNNLIFNNTYENNSNNGINLGENSDNNTIFGNICSNNLYDGIILSSNNNLISNNIVKNNGWDGIDLVYSENNLIDNNIARNNGTSGIHLYYSDNNIVSNNTAEINGYAGIQLNFSNNNRIYHNNLINNANQAFDQGTNYWDNGYPSGGNYWSDYTGADSYSGENQDMPGSDGISDTPYYIPGDSNRDRYPLMKLRMTPDYIYLTWATPDTAHTINVSWRTGGNYIGEVRYDNETRGGDPGAYSYTAEGTGGLTTPELAGYIHHVELTGLEPDTIYYFICGNSNYGWSDEHSFRTAPDQRTSFRFATGGDSRDDNRWDYHDYWPSARDDVSREMAERNPSFVLFLGDYLWSSEDPGPGYAENDTWDNWLGAAFKYWRTDDDRLIPQIPVIGNHEIVYPEPSNYDPETQATNYYTVFNLPGNERWYALSWGPDLRIIVLDSEVLWESTDAWQEQLEWLESELENSENYLWKVAAFHRPIVSSGGWNWRGRLEDWGYLFTKYGVGVVFQAHIHWYDRTYPIDSDPPPGEVAPLGEGVVYLVSGGWGGPLSSGSPQEYTAYGPESVYHFTLVDLFENGTFHSQAINRYGTVFDEFSIYRDVDVSILPGEKDGPTGETLNYEVTVKNSGNVTDSYELNVWDSAGWGPTLSNYLFENVAPGENRVTTLSVTIPENTVPYTEDNITVIATSQADNTISDSASCIAHVIGLAPQEVIVGGKDTAYNTDLEGPSPLKEYASSPPLMVAAKVGSGAVVATGTVSTTRDTRWNDINNPIPNFDVLLDKAFQWMVPGATKVLWFEGYGVYNTIDTPEVRCQQLEDALEAKGYTLTGDATTPITSGLLSGYDILVIPKMQLGESHTGGNPALLPDADVQAIKTWVEGGGGLLIMDDSDYGGHNYSEVHNKILKAIGVGFYFQDDQVQDDTNNWGRANYQPIADVDTTTEIGSAYQSETGVDEIGLYNICSLRIEVDYEVSVMVSPTIKVGEAGEILTYEVTITNVGTKSDDFTLTIEDELEWPTSLSKNEVSLENGESEVVEASVTVPEGLTEKMANWITLTASGVSEDDARFRAVNIFPLEEPPYDIAHPEVLRFLGPGLPTLLVYPPAVPVITAIETGFGMDLTPREPWPILYGKGEFAPVGAAELIYNGRVIALANSILRDAYFDRPELANDEVMSLTVRWMIDWEDPREHSLLYYVTEDSYHLPPGTGAPIVTKYIEMLEGDFGFEVGTQVGGEITPELIDDYDVLQLAELMRPLSHEEIQAVVDWVNDGGGLIIMSWADYGGYSRPKYPNELLEALDSGIRFQDDELYDEDSWVVDGPWFPQVYFLDPREANPEFDVWFPAHDFAIYMPVKSMTLENARALFRLTLTNVGTADSTYTIEVTETTTPENLGWDIEVKQAEIEVAAGENVEIYTVVTVPDIEAGRKRMDLNIKVTDGVQTYLTRSERFAVLGEDGRMPPEAKFKVGQRVSHVDWGEVTIEDVAWGGRDWVYVVETADGELKLAAEGELAEFPPGIEWDASITATFSGGSDDALFGVRPDATDNFDSVYDIPEPPAPPEPPHVRAYFYYPGQTPDELHRSYLAPEDLMEWPLRIEYVESLEDITMTWNVGDVPADYSIFLYRGGDLVADMRAEENYTFEASTGSYDFRIVVGRIVPFTLELAQGWNMISFPVLPENPRPDSIFDGYYVLYRWDAEDKRYVLHADSGSFVEPDPIVEVGVGYWAYVLENENVDLLGVPATQLTLNLRQGWDLIGLPYGGSSIADPADDPDISVLPYAFTWNAREKSYRMTQLLEAGKGYWAYALRDCTLKLPDSLLHPPQPSYPAISAIPAKHGDNEIRILVDVGSIPALEWAYSVSSTEGSYSWTTGTVELDPPYVSLGTYASGTYYVSLKHIDSGHFYFNDQTITI